ncbi:MAG: phosphate signaling complex protein PhoU [Neisseriaceae bacterium]|nr:MAG: phosphate signaling complex protein PhoU [Neisseriaceae bacterium]
MPQEHIYRQFDTELETVRARVLQMGGLVEKQIADAIEAMSSGDLELMNKVEEEDRRVNAFDVSIDEMCQHIIARRQPAATDLRMVMTVIKTTTDLERIGDEAKKIARMSKMIYEGERINMPRFREIRHMATLVLDMLHKALDAFARLDLAEAAHVVRADLHVDEEYRLIIRHLITFMMEDPRTISTSLETLSIAKALERIGDHAKNMCEYIVYLVKGKDVRHTSIEEIEREALQ